VNRPLLLKDSPTISQLLMIGTDRLRRFAVESPRVNAEMLLSFVLSMNKLDMIIRAGDTVDRERTEAYLEAVGERGRGTPVQYITETAEFFNTTLTVNEHVLIPRPETEVLVSSVLEALGSGHTGPAEGPMSILDIGTGSGAIAVALALELAADRPARIVATDISEKALEVARKNSIDSGCGDRIECRCGDMMDVLHDGEMFHVIVSNPPYVSSSEFQFLPPEVRDHEPLPSLVSGETGLEFIETLLIGAREHLFSGGLLAVEIGLGQAKRVNRMMTEFGYTGCSFRKDLSGITRIALARWQQVK